MIVIVKRHEILLEKEEEINEKEVNISKCIFMFDDEITDEFVKKAIFIKDDKTILKVINNNECNYPPEILDSFGMCLIGVVATLTRDNKIVKRFNPTPKKFLIVEGTLREADNSQPITPSEFEQYMQALQDELNRLGKEVDNVVEQGNYAKAQGDYAKSQAENVINANKEATEIINTFEENVDSYTTKFNENANSKQTSYNNNAESKITAFNNNATSKLKEYNDNADEKTSAYNTNTIDKTNKFNSNSETKLEEYNNNATQKIAEYDEHSQELNDKIIDTKNELERVKNDVLETGTYTDTYIHLEDSAMAEYQELSIDGVCEQVTTSIDNGDEYDSPSPEHPQPIATIENSLKITSCNKNLFDLGSIDDYNPSNIIKNIYNNAINVIIKEAGLTYTYNTKNKFKGNEIYYVSALSEVQNARFHVRLRNSDDTNWLTSSDINIQNMTYNSSYKGWYWESNDINMKKTIQIPKCLYWELGVGYSTKSGEIGKEYKIYNIQVSKNNNDTFEQHLETQITANLPEGEFAGKIDETTKDKFRLAFNEADGKYHLYLDKMLGKVTLDGSEDMIKAPNNNYFSITADVPIVAKGWVLYPMVSNYYIGRTFDSLYKADVDYGVAFSNSNKRVSIRNKDIHTVEEMKSWLSTHNTEVYYLLETPYTIDLGVVDMPLSYNEITNLFTDSDLMPTINAKYYRNFISTIQNLQVNEKALKQELVDINARLSALESASANVVSEGEVVEQ